MTKIKYKETPRIYKLGDIPFIIGSYCTPYNPDSLPNILPFSYFLDPYTNILSQNYSKDIECHLQTAYKKGTHPGTPMDTEGEGAKYLFDFLNFIEKTVPELNTKQVLEIGCGQGFLLKLLQEKSGEATGIEPGGNLKAYWEKNDVSVINGFFPSSELNNTFDLIVSFAVLEHIYDAKQFVNSIADHLSDDGQIILAVPNCEQQMENCDPSLFIHEHYSYFSRDSLAHFLELLGFKINLVTYAGYGGSIYICAQKSQTLQKQQHKYVEFDIDTFANKVNDFISHINEQTHILKKQNKSLGIYCPGRAITSIPLNANYRFFDDDNRIYGQYLPPFFASIENRQDLTNNPVDVLWIFSYSFGDQIKKELTEYQSLSQTEILTLDELRKQNK